MPINRTASDFKRRYPLTTHRPTADNTKTEGLKVEITGYSAVRTAQIRDDAAADGGHIRLHHCYGLERRFGARTAQSTTHLTSQLATLWRVHLVTVIDLSRSHLVLAKIGSRNLVELPTQRGHSPWALAA